MANNSRRVVSTPMLAHGLVVAMARVEAPVFNCRILEHSNHESWKGNGKRKKRKQR